MKKVLMVAPTETNGRYAGGIYSVMNILKDYDYLFKNKGIDVEYLNTNIITRKPYTIGKFKLNNIKNAVLLLNRIFSITKKNITTVYYHTSTGFAFLRDCIIIHLLKLFNKRNSVCLHIHSSDIDEVFTNNKLYKKYTLFVIKKYVNDIILLSNSTKSDFISLGFQANKCHTVYNFHHGKISLERMNEKVNGVTDKKEFSLLFLGSIDKNKGIIELLKALKNISFPYKLHLCGVLTEQDVKSEYCELLQCLGEQVVEHGYVSGEEKEILFQNCDCLILPSYSEGFPIVICEALAHACSCVVTPVGAIPEVLHNNENCIFVPVGDVNSISDALINLWNDRQLIIKQMKNNYKSADAFTVETFVNNIASII